MVMIWFLVAYPTCSDVSAVDVCDRDRDTAACEWLLEIYAVVDPNH